MMIDDDDDDGDDESPLRGNDYRHSKERVASLIPIPLNFRCSFFLNKYVILQVFSFLEIIPKDPLFKVQENSWLLGLILTLINKCDWLLWKIE